MGGRKGPYTRAMTGGGKATGASTRKIHTNLVNKSPKVAAEVVFEVMASTSPTIGALYVAYKVAKFVKPIAEEGIREYKKTRDSDKATEKMVQETVKQTGKQIVSKSIGIVVDAVYSQTVESLDIETNEIVDKIVTSATSKVIKEIVMGD